MSDSSSRIVGQILKQFRLKNGLSRADLAAKVGTHHNQIVKLENGERKLTIEWIEKLAPHLNTTLQEFLSQLPEAVEAVQEEDAAEQTSIVEIHGIEFARLPVYDLRFAAGPGALNEQNAVPIDYQIVSMQMLRSLTDTPLSEIWIFEVRGDSMEPTLKDRDLGIIDGRKKNLRIPGIYTLDVDGEALIKHCSQHLETGAVTLVSENPRYKPQTIKQPDKLVVVGRLIISMRRHG